MPRLSAISCVGNRSKKTTAATAFQTLLATKAPWGRYAKRSVRTFHLDIKVFLNLF